MGRPLLDPASMEQFSHARLVTWVLREGNGAWRSRVNSPSPWAWALGTWAPVPPGHTPRMAFQPGGCAHSYSTGRFIPRGQDKRTGLRSSPPKAALGPRPSETLDLRFPFFRDTWGSS